MIKSIDSTEVAKITSGQVIIEVVSVVKELVENSLDAGSNKIEVTFSNHGLSFIEVSDNGRGIEKADFELLCLRHHTSKLDSFEELTMINTLGFRGEALASLCAVADVKVSTCSSSLFPKATTLEYSHTGEIASLKTAVLGKKGTTVTVKDLFKNVPVRQKYLAKGSKREYTKALGVLIGYMLVYTDVRFSVFHITAAGKKSMVMGTQGGAATKITDNLVSVYGSNGAHGMIPIRLDVDNIDARFKLGLSSVAVLLKLVVSGYISDCSFGMGRLGTDRQYLYVNKRPVVHKKFAKVVNDVYKSFNHTQNPVFVLDFQLDTQQVDVNVTPDKRSVMLQNEDVLAEVLREELENFFDTLHNCVPKSQLGTVRLGLRDSQSQLPDAMRSERPARSVKSEKLDLSQFSVTEITLPLDTQDSSKHAPDQSELESEPEQEPEIEPESEPEQEPEQEYELDYEQPEPEPESEQPEPEQVYASEQEVEISYPYKEPPPVEGAPEKEDDFLLSEEAKLFVDDNDNEEDEEDHDNHSCCSHHLSQLNHLNHQDTQDPSQIPENSQEAIGPADQVLTASIASSSKKEQLYKIRKESGHTGETIKRAFHGIDEEPQKKQKTLSNLANVHDVRESLVIQKQNFATMNVVGQFNLGFIVVTHGDRLFIVDQHALDEIYNYERLFRLLSLRAQPLVVPRKLELSPIDEMLVLDQIEQLRKNGFLVKEIEDAPPGQRVMLSAVPVSKNVVFDDSDLHELVQKLHEAGPSQATVRCRKVDVMIALRACRLSIMVGQPLTTLTMSTVVQHLAGLEKPWNCPHGRPTMRHLADVDGNGFVDDYVID